MNTLKNVALAALAAAAATLLVLLKQAHDRGDEYRFGMYMLADAHAKGAVMVNPEDCFRRDDDRRAFMEWARIPAHPRPTIDLPVLLPRRENFRKPKAPADKPL